jgi:hypothetical protein
MSDTEAILDGNVKNNYTVSVYSKIEIKANLKE